MRSAYLPGWFLIGLGIIPFIFGIYGFTLDTTEMTEPGWHYYSSGGVLGVGIMFIILGIFLILYERREQHERNLEKCYVVEKKFER